MKRYSQHEIEALLDKFMDGQTTVEEEAQLADYFRSGDVPAEWEDYRDMFGYFDRGMEGNLVPAEAARKPLTALMGRRWWGIGAAACITAAIVATTVLHHSSPSTQQQEHLVQEQVDTPAIALPPVVEVEPQQLASASPERPVRSARQVRSTRPSTRNLKEENAKLARENERLQRELADLKRRSFIIDLDANGYKTVLNEDGNIVLIDMEQEIENELNNQQSNNFPAI